MTKISKLIMEIYFKLGIKPGRGLLLQKIYAKIDLENKEDLPWGLKNLIEEGYLEVKNEKLNFYFLTEKGCNYLANVGNKSKGENLSIDSSKGINKVPLYLSRTKIKSNAKSPFKKYWILEFIIAPLFVTVFAGVILHSCLKNDTIKQTANVSGAEEVNLTQVGGNYYNISLPSEINACPTTMLEISELADRCLWEWTKNWGDRTIYENLLRCHSRANDSEIKKLFFDQIKRIANDYTASILVPRVDSLPSVCQLHTMNGDKCIIEPVNGFNAGNVIDQLDMEKYPRAITRARAASILRNIKTALNKDKIRMNKVIKTLVFIMKEDPSLLVSKLALDRYSQFTRFSPSGIFDFQSAINDFQEKSKHGQTILLPEFNFTDERP